MMRALPALNVIRNALIRNNRRSFTAPMTLVSRDFAIKRTTTRKSIKKSAPAPSAPATVDEAWEPVTDPATGGIYYWNTMTNEVTHVGAAHPMLAAQQAQGQGGGIMQPQTQGGGMMSGLGGVVAQGMAFGVGSSIAHHAVGSMMGHGGGGHHEAPPQDAGGDFDGDFDL